MSYITQNQLDMDIYYKYRVEAEIQKWKAYSSNCIHSSCLFTSSHRLVIKQH